MSDDAIAQIRKLEEKRSQLLLAADLAGLSALLSDDLVHIHTTGVVETKAQYLAGVQNRLQFLAANRRDYNERVYGDVAVATGRLDQTVKIKATGQERKLEAVTTQVWRKSGGSWVICSFHACLIPQPAS